MKFREYQSSDLKEICELFYETITTINMIIMMSKLGYGLIAEMFF